jgi:ABC-type nitrate/sulfonate/bicarbonate transport system substrate-binding protein
MTNAYRRQTLAGIAGTALALPWRAWSEPAPRAIRVTQAVTSLSYMHSYVAQSQGYFKEAGLTAELVDTGGGGPDVQLVLAGRAELTVNDGAQVLPALQQGQALKCVMSLLDKSIINATIRKETADRLGITATTPFVEKIAKLKGLKIGVTRPGALTWQQARFNLISAGLNPDRDAEVIGIGGASALGAALENGRVDVIYISMPIGERLVQSGKGVSLVNNARGEDPRLASFMMEGLWATPDFIKANRDVVTRAVRAYVRAGTFIRDAGIEDVVAAVKPALGSVGDDVLLEGVKGVKPAVSRTGRMDNAELAATQLVLRENGALNQEFKLDDVFDGSFLAA